MYRVEKLTQNFKWFTSNVLTTSTDKGKGAIYY